MSWISSTIGRKVAMALSALFLISFLIIHVAINFLSVFSEEMYNVASHFMGTNPLIQFAMQPVLILGVVFHFVMGFILEAKNRASRPVKYAKKDDGASSSWLSRNMMFSGLVILAFLGLHFVDFWIPEIDYKYISMKPAVEDRYYEELVHRMQDPLRVGAYVVAFVLLMMHLLHGFQSSFQSMGVNNKFTPAIQAFCKAFAYIVPLAFIFIAIFHFLNH
ncbi:MAG: succinate dehydrogenase cytochrome b subunit [Cyclobacteriaceae bacterium]